MSQPEPISIRLIVGGVSRLTVDDVWPDGDAPENPTADDVIALMDGDLLTTLRDWNLDCRLTVRVSQPNPHYMQAESLIPEMAPRERIITTAELTA